MSNVTVIRQGVGCRVSIRSTSPSQVRVRNGIAHVTAGVPPIRSRKVLVNS